MLIKRRSSVDAAADDYLFGEYVNEATANIVNIEIDPLKQQSMLYVAPNGNEQGELKSLQTGSFVQGKAAYNGADIAGQSFHS